jgi:hypothetical protein
VTTTIRLRVPNRSVALFAAVLAVPLTGCGSAPRDGGISLRRLDREVETVSHLNLLLQGFDYDTTAACSPDGADGLRFTCRLEATYPRTPTQTWTVRVTCQARVARAADLPRCLSDTGQALQ